MHCGLGFGMATTAETGNDAGSEAVEEYAAMTSTTSHLDAYRAVHAQSIAGDAFWAEQGTSLLTWDRPFDIVSHGGFEHGDVAWYLGGRLNACVNCVDRHLATRGEQTAILWEGDEPGVNRRISYNELHREVCKIANAMKQTGVRRGDVVTIYMPMVPEIAMVMLACARIGAPHSVVFAGFSAESLRERIVDGASKWVFTTDEGKRGGKTLPLKQIVDDAVSEAPCVEKIFVFRRTENPEVGFTEGRDIWIDDLLPSMRPFCTAESMDSEDVLFILYTSGSTGRPKGVAHSTAGYLTYVTMTTRHTFDLREGDVYACVADCGWITGHSYIVYGPLCNGTTTVMFESVPTYPDHGRYWDMVERLKITQFYTAPTAIRALMRFGPEKVTQYDRTSLRILGTVGEPINPEAWRWYFNVVGEGRCTIVDTYWQTETGGHVGSNLPGITPMRPGSCAFPHYGIDFCILDNEGNEITETVAEGILAIRKPWPGLARTVWGDHDRYLNVYMRPFPGYYFTGDGCRRDAEGFYWITGRVDDVLNTSGHRIGTAEVESAIVGHEAAAEAAVVGFPHDVKGQGICCYVILREGHTDTADVRSQLRQAVRDHIGPFATPDLIVIVPGLPKTRSGKIMRRILRKIAEGELDRIGDTSTLADPSIVDKVVALFNERDRERREAAGCTK